MSQNQGPFLMSTHGHPSFNPRLPNKRSSNGLLNSNAPSTRPIKPSDKGPLSYMRYPRKTLNSSRNVYDKRPHDLLEHEDRSGYGGMRSSNPQHMDAVFTIEPAAEDEEADDVYFSSRHMAAARFQRNQRLLCDVFNEVCIPDLRSNITVDRIVQLRRQVDSLKSHRETFEKELQELEEKHLEKKRKFLESNEKFHNDYLEACSSTNISREKLNEMLQRFETMEKLQREKQQQIILQQQQQTQHPQASLPPPTGLPMTQHLPAPTKTGVESFPQPVPDSIVESEPMAYPGLVSPAPLPLPSQVATVAAPPIQNVIGNTTPVPFAAANEAMAPSQSILNTVNQVSVPTASLTSSRSKLQQPDSSSPVPQQQVPYRQTPSQMPPPLPDISSQTSGQLPVQIPQQQSSPQPPYSNMPISSTTTASTIPQQIVRPPMANSMYGATYQQYPMMNVGYPAQQQYRMSSGQSPNQQMNFQDQQQQQQQQQQMMAYRMNQSPNMMNMQGQQPMHYINNAQFHNRPMGPGQIQSQQPAGMIPMNSMMQGTAPNAYNRQNPYDHSNVPYMTQQPQMMHMYQQPGQYYAPPNSYHMPQPNVMHPQQSSMYQTHSQNMMPGMSSHMAQANLPPSQPQRSPSTQSAYSGHDDSALKSEDESFKEEPRN
ncbi:unnamed protein product [Didymodactylos carnosus]|uniref:Uncharacterized protein n=2 Tax=Didymodactylos carnosus TaxID=1234261 RepID=A0A8S2HHV0_9BILA|nr:unnamed protein product [Didymodactylos carnosus]CAF3649784.1 unnamed protein product [Didymodactylos carnosus]